MTCPTTSDKFCQEIADNYIGLPVTAGDGGGRLGTAENSRKYRKTVEDGGHSRR